MKAIGKSSIFCAAVLGVWLPLAVSAQPVSYTITTVAGDGQPGFIGDNQAATGAALNVPQDIAFDTSGNMYIADSVNQRIRKVSGGIITTIVGDGLPGYAGDGGPPLKAELLTPYAVVLDAAGNLYIADLENEVIREVSGGIINTIAGSYAIGYSGDGGSATAATFNEPAGLAIDSSGNLYITDHNNAAIRKVDTSGNISTFAGTGVAGFSGDGGLASKARLNAPEGIAFDAAGNFYIADSGNQRIRKVSPAGIITTVVGNGTPGFAGDGGPALAAELYRPFDMKIDAAGNMFIADYNNCRIRMAAANGQMYTIAGEDEIGYSGDGGAATSAKLNFPTSIALDGTGAVYFADSSNDVVRKLTPVAGSTTAPPLIDAGGVIGASQFGAFTTVAPGSWIEIYGSNLGSTERSWATADFNGNQAPTSLDQTSVTIGGQKAAIDYVSGNQINVQVPNIASGPQQLIVNTPAGANSPYTVTIAATEPGLLAPSVFDLSGHQYVGATFTDGATYVLPSGAIAGLASHPASVGDTIVLYGVGFGPVTPTTAPGQIAQGQTKLTLPLEIFFGSAPATIVYQGLAPGYVGLYQFDVVVPSVSSGAVPLTFMLNSISSTQTLYTVVQ